MRCVIIPASCLLLRPTFLCAGPTFLRAGLALLSLTVRALLSLQSTLPSTDILHVLLDILRVRPPPHSIVPA